MSSLPRAERGDQPKPDLRARRRERTKAEIQQRALALFEAQGYAATTIEQIAEAAEISPSTFFRYFPTKEDVVAYAVFNPNLLETVRDAPPDVPPLAAMRRALVEGLRALTPQELEHQRTRSRLILSEPSLRARLVDGLAAMIGEFAGVIAERAGRQPDDPRVLALTGAVLGVALAALLPAMEDVTADYAAIADEALGFLEAGLPL